MEVKRFTWTWRARRADAYWERGIPLDEDRSGRAPAVFQAAVRRAAAPLLLRMAEDEAVLRGLEAGRHLDPEDLVDGVLADRLGRLDPSDGVGLAIAKLQLALLEAIDEVLAGDVMDEDDLMDREWTDERGLIDFL